MDLEDVYKLFPIHLPIADQGITWNGEPDEFSNIGWGVNYSQKFGLTPFAKTGVYGKLNGQPIPHFGHDFAGFQRTPLVTPCKVWISRVEYEDKGYGNYVFMETDTKTQNGVTVKMEYVLAHMDEKPTVQVGHWYNEGSFVGPMGTTGNSTGFHTHFGGRPLVRKPDGSWSWLFGDQLYRGYIDLEPCIVEELVYDKQILINYKNIMSDFEKKLIIEGEGSGRKFIVINGELREITRDRESASALYILANNGLGKTVKTDFIKKSKIGKAF